MPVAAAHTAAGISANPARGALSSSPPSYRRTAQLGAFDPWRAPLLLGLLQLLLMLPAHGLGEPTAHNGLARDCDSRYNESSFRFTASTHHLVCGPVQDDEAIFLFGMLRTLRPMYVLEIGVLEGISTEIIAEAIGSDSMLYAVDKNIIRKAKDRLEPYPWVKLLQLDMLKMTAEDLDNRTFDFIFLDASHKFEHYVQMLPFLQTILSYNGILMTHDTGLHRNSTHLKDVCRGFMIPNGCHCDAPGLCGYPHRPDNRRFTNWVLETQPDWQVVHFHSFRRIRHGFTLLTRKRLLATSKSLDMDCNGMGTC